MARKNYIAIWILIIIALTSCSGSSSAVLDDSSCQAPCWRNISMGMPKEEVYLLLANMDDISQDSIHTDRNDRRFWNEAVSWRFLHRKEDEGVAYFRNTNVVMIYFKMKDNIPLSTLLEKYGEPQEILIYKEILDGIRVVVDIIYPGREICFEEYPRYLIREPQKYEIKPSTAIETIYFVDSSATEGQSEIGCLEGFNSTDQIQYIQEWKGYGEYVVHQAGEIP